MQHSTDGTDDELDCAEWCVYEVLTTDGADSLLCVTWSRADAEHIAAAMTTSGTQFYARAEYPAEDDRDSASADNVYRLELQIPVLAVIALAAAACVPVVYVVAKIFIP